MSVNFLLQTKEKRMQHSISNYRHCAVWHISGTYSFCTAETLFSSVAQSCPILCDPMDCSTPGFPVLHRLSEFTQTHVHQVGDAIQPSHPLLSLSPPTFSLSQCQSFFPASQFFTSGGQSIGVSASASVQFSLSVVFPSL